MNDKGIFYISVQCDKYHKKIKTSKHGERVFYFYNEKDISELANDIYEVVYTYIQTLKENKWLIIVFRKI